MRILGIDYGTVRVGLAISDATGLIAQPMGILPGGNAADLAKRILVRSAELAAEKIVLGLPRHMSGEEGESAGRVRALGEQLETHGNLPVVYWDERLSTAAAERALIEANVSRKKRKGKIDAVAAAVILQNYLDHQQLANDLPA